MIIDEDEYVDYDVGAVFPEGLSYIPGQGLSIFGADPEDGTGRKQLVINPDLLKGTVAQVNLFDEDNGELNPDLYDQMALPDGMSFDRSIGLTLSGVEESGKELVINPNNISSKKQNLFNENTKKIDVSISTLPTGLTYSQDNGLEIEGETTQKTLVINPNGFVAKTSLFETDNPKINEDLYDAGGDSRLPEWVHFNELSRTMIIEGYPNGENEQPCLLHLNAGSLKESLFIVNRSTGLIKSELPEGMSYSRSTGLRLENETGGGIQLNVGNGKISDVTTIVDAVDYSPDNPHTGEFYMANIIPSYLHVSGTDISTLLHVNGFNHVFDSVNNTFSTNIGDSSVGIINYNKVTKEEMKVYVDQYGLDPDGLKEGINAEKITKGTLHRPIQITNEATKQKMIITYNSIQTQNGIVSGETVNYYDSFLFINTKNSLNNTFHPLIAFFDWNGSTNVTEMGFAVYEEDIMDYTTSDITKVMISPDGGINYTGTKSTFQVYPSGNMSIYSKENNNIRTNIMNLTIQCVKNNSLLFSSCMDSDIDLYSRTVISHSLGLATTLYQGKERTIFGDSYNWPPILDPKT